MSQPAPKYGWRYLGDRCLTTPTRLVMSLDEIPAGLIERMGELMHRGWTQGVGITANQVGADVRVCLVTLAKADSIHREARVMINPRIIEKSPGTRTLVEACLSLPNFDTTIARHAWIVVEYYDDKFKLRTQKLVDFDAQVVQHNVDLLDGKLITDSLPRQQRRAAERLAAKYVERRRRSA